MNKTKSECLIVSNTICAQQGVRGNSFFSSTQRPPSLLSYFRSNHPGKILLSLNLVKKQMDIMHGHELKYMEDIPTSKNAYIFSFDISHIPAKIQCCAALQLKILIFNQPLRLFHLYWSLYCVSV